MVLSIGSPRSVVFGLAALLCFHYWLDQLKSNLFYYRITATEIACYRSGQCQTTALWLVSGRSAGGHDAVNACDVFLR